MYQPPHFREDRIEVQHGLIRSHPLGLLITAGPGGLQANAIPFLVYSDLATKDFAPHGTLRAHMARGNPQWRELAAVERMPGRVPGAAAIHHAVLVSDQAGDTAKSCRPGTT